MMHWRIIIIRSSSKINRIHVYLLHILYRWQPSRSLLLVGPLQAVGVVGFLYVALCQIRVVLFWQLITKVHQILREANSLKQNALFIILSQEVREELLHPFGESRQTHDLFASWSGLRIHLEQ